MELKRAPEEKRAFMESILESLGDPTIVINKDCEITWMNRSAREFLFGPSPPLKTFFCYQCHHRKESPCDGIEYDCPMMRVYESRKPISVVHEHYRSDGEKRLVEIIASPLLNKEGAFQGIVQTMRDITERKFAEEALRTSENLLQTIIESEPECVKLISPDGALLMMNRAGLAMIEADSLDQVKGKSVYPLIPPEYLKEFKALMEGVFQGRKGTLHFEIVGIKGRRLWLETHAVPLRNEKGEIIAFLGITRDITEQKQTEDKIDFLASIVRTLPDAVCSIDLKGNIRSWNEGAEKMLGYKTEEILGKHIAVVIPEELVSIELSHCINLLNREGSFTGYESIRISKSGKKVPVEITAVAMKDKEEKIVSYASIMRDITERKKSEEALRESEERVRLLMESAEDIIVMQDMEGRYLYYNATPRYGLKVEDVVGKTPFDFFDSATAAKMLGRIRRVAASGMSLNEETQLTWGGETVWFSDQVSPVKDADGRMKALVTISRNITERKKLEGQLHHAQKIEAIGQLAGGVAHDFNNILTAVIGYAGLLQMKMKENDPLRHYVDDIIASSEKAASLTQGLLAFSRKQIMNPKLTDLNKIIEGVEKLLLRIIGEDIELKIILKDADLFVLADGGQMEQVLMNLCANARDAMPDGGMLTIEAERVELGEEYIKAHGFGTPGTYALLSVADSGVGMDERTRERIFEPYFTTKELGKGTGLGLSMAYGMIKQHNGYINVYSESGEGTIFKIYLPSLESEQKETKLPDSVTAKGGTETVLLAEDDTDVRRLAKEVLDEFGYTVIETVDGEDAIKTFIENKGGIDLLVLDVLMPKKNGKEVYEKIKKIRPGIKVLFTSGYTKDLIVKKGILEEGLHFITKPIFPTELLKKVREILDTK